MIIFGLGSNRGDRLLFLRQAVRELAVSIRDLRCSPVYESAALLPKDAPPDWDMPFLNMVVAGQADIDPGQLLVHIKSIEKSLGRQNRGSWGPREIDIDILAVGENNVSSETLTLPHPHMLSRDFVMLPLADLLPQWRYPGQGEFHGMGAAAIVQMQGFCVGDKLRKTDKVPLHG